MAEQSPGDNVVVESAGRFYLWNLTADFVYRIAEPAANVGEILKRLGSAPDWEWDIKLVDIEELPGPSDYKVSLDYDRFEGILEGLRP